MLARAPLCRNHWSSKTRGGRLYLVLLLAIGAAFFASSVDAAVANQTNPNLGADGSGDWSIGPVGDTGSASANGDLEVTVTDGQGNVLYQHTNPGRGMFTGPSFFGPAPPQGGPVTATAKTSVNGQEVGRATQQVNPNGPPARAPSVSGGSSGACSTGMSITYQRDATWTRTLHVDFRDGQTGDYPIYPGSGNYTLSLNHTYFGQAWNSDIIYPPGTVDTITDYQLTATIVETGAWGGIAFQHHTVPEGTPGM